MDDYLWWRDGVIYQIYPRSFSDSNNDGLGDLPGITAHLDYLAQLGIDAIWLSPFYPTPDADFGYDISDHTQVDERFGTLQDFDHMLEQAHTRGIRIVLDLVLNHTSDQHPWFVESRSSLVNPKRDWYLWREKKNNWQAVFGGSGWTFDDTTCQYYYHMFLPEQPDLNWHKPEVCQAQLDVVRFWLERGVDGFRLDVFNVYFKDREFRDNPVKLGLRGFDRQEHLHDSNQPEMLTFLKEFRKLLEKYSQRYSVGETFMATPEKAASYVGDQLLHAAFSFDFTKGDLFFPWNPDWVLKQILRREEIFKDERWPTTVMSNHDLPRAASRYSRKEEDFQSRFAMTLLMTLRGTPFLYYGEEIGMRDLRLKHSQVMDPPGIRFWPFYKGRDGCRGPMQWDDSTYSGFSNTQPWLPVHPDYKERNVSRQEQTPNSMLHLTRTLIHLRKQFPALRQGKYKPLISKSKHVLAFLRQIPGQTILVAINYSKRKIKTSLDKTVTENNWDILIPESGGTPYKNGVLELEPYMICIMMTGG
ncbi:MAG: alpha-amylase family glycosyl hydrolase [Chloroflexota bacterium]